MPSESSHRIPSPSGIRCTQVESPGGELLLIEILLAVPSVPGELSEAERAVLRLLLLDNGVGDIARARGTALSTVRNQIRSIHRKLGVSSQPELALHCFGSRSAGTASTDLEAMDDGMRCAG
jgi:DNA-binding CsgD family transcriptional regulator